MYLLSELGDDGRVWILATFVEATGRRRSLGWTLPPLMWLGAESAFVNLGLKRVWRRPRPDRVAHEVPELRHVPMPSTRSFPSGHSAAAFAFAGGAGKEMTAASLPLHALATVVAYSRVHSGVHYPLDALVGAVLGSVVSQVSSHELDRIRNGRGGTRRR